MKKKLYLLFIILVGIIFIPNVYAETYDGEYTTEYLLKNYSAVVLGHGSDSVTYPDGSSVPSGIADLTYVGSIKGAILVSKDLFHYYSGTIHLDSGDIKSYVGGNIPDNCFDDSSSEVINDPNYFDFEKMYSVVMTDSQAMADEVEYRIVGEKLEVSKPGNYSINNTAVYKNSVIPAPNSSNTLNYNTILIKNFDKNKLYIFNFFNDYATFVPEVSIMENGSASAISLVEYIDSGNYNGNIIFNFPNAKFISIGENLNGRGTYIAGTIIAPNAFISLYYYNNTSYFTLICNSLSSYKNIFKVGYNIEEKLVKESVDYVEEVVDYDDDYYSRDYSISDLLQNYSLITLGKKQIDSKSKLLELGNTPGSTKIFHITGPALISGDLYGNICNVNNNPSYCVRDEYGYFYKYDRTIFDLESNKVTESFVKGTVVKTLSAGSSGSPRNNPISVIQPWDNMAGDNMYYNKKNNFLFVGGQSPNNSYTGNGYYSDGKYVDPYSMLTNQSIINFDRLYDNIVAEQSKIDEGEEVSTEEVTHLKIGGNYVIEDINSINEIVFDDFDKEKDELTIITIKNTGDINFPLISKDTGNYKGIVTNDYFGKEKATHLYEADTFISEDSYHGNIVWNVPNATYIKLKENAPFAGHLIAPHADVDTPELHFAGCFIVNSIYGEGNTEAHFYPITAMPKCDCQEYEDLSEYKKGQYSSYRLRKMLGGEGTTIEKTVLGNEEEYQEDISTYEVISNKCNVAPPSSGSITEILTNPKTYRKLGLIILLLMPFGYILLKKKKIN